MAGPAMLQPKAYFIPRKLFETDYQETGEENPADILY